MSQLSLGGRSSRRYVRRIRRTRIEVAAALDELRGERRAGVNPSRVPLGVYLESWVRDARNIRPTTRHGYAAVVTYHLAPTLGDVRLVDLTPLHVEAALARLAPTLSPKSLRNVHAVLRRALGQAVRAGILTRNVAAREFVDAPRVPVEEPRALTLPEIRRFLDVIHGDRLEALYLAALGTGLRQGELLGLAWEDLDLDAGALHVRRELVRRAGEYRREELKTDRSRRAVPLAAPLVDALRAHRDRVIAAGFVATATGPVFTTPAGTPLSGSWVTHHFYALLERAQINRLPFKNLRTTFSSRLFAEGVPDRIIADLLGHTRVATTQGHYIATGASSQVSALDAVGRMLG
jgi:integrase